MSQSLTTSEDPKKLYIVEACTGIPRPATAHEIVAASRTAISTLMPSGNPMDTPTAVRHFAETKLGGWKHEIFAAILLDARLRKIEYRVIAEGTVNQATIYPRKLVEAALTCHAVNVVVMHNHPSGDLSPSQADLVLTRKLADSLALVDTRLVDHIIVGYGQSLSMAETGYL